MTSEERDYCKLEGIDLAAFKKGIEYIDAPLIKSASVMIPLDRTQCKQLQQNFSLSILAAFCRMTLELDVIKKTASNGGLGVSSVFIDVICPCCGDTPIS